MLTGDHPRQGHTRTSLGSSSRHCGISPAGGRAGDWAGGGINRTTSQTIKSASSKVVPIYPFDTPWNKGAEGKICHC